MSDSHVWKNVFYLLCLYLRQNACVANAIVNYVRYSNNYS